MFASYVLCFVKNALVDTLHCFTMATGANFQTVTFCPSGTMARIYLSMKFVPKSTSMTNYYPTTNSTVVSELAVRIRIKMLPFALGWSFDTDKRNRCTSLKTVGNRSVGW